MHCLQRLQLMKTLNNVSKQIRRIDEQQLVNFPVGCVIMFFSKGDNYSTLLPVQFKKLKFGVAGESPKFVDDLSSLKEWALNWFANSQNDQSVILNSRTWETQFRV